MKLCLSIAPTSMSEAVERLRQVRAQADLVEVRIDGISDLDLYRLLRQPRPHVIITNRRSDEGGKFAGSATEQFDILSEAIKLGAEFVDVELKWGTKFVQRIIRQSRRTRVICSYHNFTETPNNLLTIYQKIRQTQADIVKIATMANDIIDSKRALQLLKRARQDRQKAIALCMGEAGEISRILGGLWGSFLTYGSLAADECTAPGQRTITDLKKIFRVGNLDGRTKVFGLVGNPVRYSRGIYYHNRRFARAKVNAVYVNFFINDLEDFLATFRSIITGLSITMPFKHKIIPLLDQSGVSVKELGVANTVIKRRGQLTGYNTDLPAIYSILKKRTSIRNERVVVLGTGATARTMAYVSVLNHGRTTIVGRSAHKAQDLANDLGCEWTTFDHLSTIQCDILMNGTSVGMAGSDQNTKLVPKRFFRRGMVVFDAVSNPPMTVLLQDAKDARCEIITGMELFNRQAQLQSKLFLECLK